MIRLTHYLFVAPLVFALGLFCLLNPRDSLGILMGIELILNAANINFLAFARFGPATYDGQIVAIFVIMLAAAEAVVGLAIVLGIYQTFHSIDVEATETLRG